MDINETAMTLLLEENKALKAQVNKLKEVSTLLFNGGWDYEHSLLINNLAKGAIDSTPLHCLNQVKADAIEEAAHKIFIDESHAQQAMMFHAGKLRNSNG